MTSSRSWTRRAPIAALVGSMAVVSIWVLAACGNTPSATGSSTSASAPVQRFTTVDGMLADQPFIVAHRGGSARWPEFSITAYDNAVRWGVGALELSVARTSDGVFFGLHDATLDRTSKVSGSVNPKDLTWQQLTSQYQNKLNAPSAAGVPYASAEEIFRKFANDHVIFVDPKYIGDSQERNDLVDLMLSYAPADHWVLKGFYNDTQLASLARDRGIASWGYYFAKDAANVSATGAQWDMLGLDIEAPTTDWRTFTNLGKPVIAFFISSPTEVDTALRRGAAGLMTDDIPATAASPKLSPKYPAPSP